MSILGLDNKLNKCHVIIPVVIHKVLFRFDDGFLEKNITKKGLKKEPGVPVICSLPANH